MRRPRKTSNLPEARENASYQSIGLSFASDWLRRWREFLDQSQNEIKQNQASLRVLSKFRSKLF